MQPFSLHRATARLPQGACNLSAHGTGFAEQLHVLVDEDYPDADVVVVVVDNMNHTDRPASTSALRRLKLHAVRQGSRGVLRPNTAAGWTSPWREPSVLASQCLSWRITDKATLIREVVAWEVRLMRRTSGSTGSSQRPRSASSPNACIRFPESRMLPNVTLVGGLCGRDHFSRPSLLLSVSNRRR